MAGKSHALEFSTPGTHLENGKSSLFATEGMRNLSANAFRVPPVRLYRAVDPA
jgi:hypothetical protein